jgi:hypothetical protein
MNEVKFGLIRFHKREQGHSWSSRPHSNKRYVNKYECEFEIRRSYRIFFLQGNYVQHVNKHVYGMYGKAMFLELKIQYFFYLHKEMLVSTRTEIRTSGSYLHPSRSENLCVWVAH